MSNSVDNRVVQMGFDHEKFDRGVDQAIEKIDSLNTSLAGLGGASKSASFLEKITSKFNFSNILAGTSEAAKGLTNMQLIGLSALDALTKKAVDLGVSLTQNIGNKLIGPMKEGFGEYQTQMGAVQTVLTNTADKGTKIEDVNKAFAELNTYADKTIYNFAEMTRNIGTFTAAGVDLEKSTTAIKGIANLAAGSGSNSQQASTAMYQLSQALAAGTVKLQDWNSVVNAGMGGQLFQNELKKTAKQYGIDVDSLIEKNGSFRESLQEGWITSDILIDTLNRFADDSTDIGKRLTAAATEVKTFGELFDSMGESIGSGWARLWQTIVGDYDEAKKTLTEIFNAFDSVVGGMFDSINNTAAEWKKLGGRTKLIDALRLAIQNAYKIVVTAKDAFASVFPPKTGKDLMNLTTKFYNFVKAATPVKGTLNTITTLVTGMANGFKLLGTVFGGAKAFLPVIKNIANYFQTLFVGIANYITYLSNLRVLSDAIMSVWYAFKNVIQSLADVFKDVFPTSILDKLPEVTEIILHNLVKLRELLAENKDRIANIFNAVLNVEKSVLKLFGTITSNVSKNDILPKIITLLAKVGNLIANIINSILENKTIMSIVGGAISFITTVASKLLDVITSIFDGFDSFKKSLSELFGLKIGKQTAEVGDKLSDVGDKLGKVGESTNTLANIFSKLGNVFSTVKEKITEFINNLFGKKVTGTTEEDANKATTAIEKTGEAIEKVEGPLDKIKNFFSTLGEKLSNLWSTMSKGAGPMFEKVLQTLASLFTFLLSCLRQLTFHDIFKAFSIIFGGKLSRNLGKISKGIAGMFDGLGGMFENIGKGTKKLEKALGGFFKNLGKSVKSFGKLASAKALKEIAVAVVMLAGALFVISLIDIDALLPALGVITALISELVAAVAILSKAKIDVGGLLSASSAFVSFGVSIILLAISLKMISSIPTDSLIASTTAIGLLLTLMTLIIVRLSKAASGLGNKSKTIKSFGSVMVKMAASILILAIALKMVASIDQKTLFTSVLVIIALMGVLTIMVKQLSGLSDMGKGVSSTMLSMAISILIMSLAISMLSKIDQKAMGISLLAIIALMGVITLLVDKLAKNGKISGIASTFLSIAATVLIVSFALSMLSKIDIKTLVVSTLAVIALLGVFTLLISNLKDLSPEQAFAIAIAFSTLSGSVTTLAFALSILAGMDVKTIGVAALALSAMLIVIAIIAKSLDNVDTKSLHAMSIFLPSVSAALVLMAFSLLLLKDIKPGSLIIAISGLIALLVAIALITKLIDIESMALLGPMLSLIGVGLTGFAIAILILSKIPVAGLIKALIAIVVFIGVIAIACRFLKPTVFTLMQFAYSMLILSAAMALTAISIVIFTIALSALGASLMNLIFQIQGALGILVYVAPEMAKNLTKIMEGVLPELEKQFQMLITFLLNQLVFLMQQLAAKVPEIVGSLLDMIVGILNELQKEDRMKNIIKDAFNILWQIIEGLLESLIEHTPKLTKDIVEWIATSLESLHHELQTNGDRIARGIADIIGDLLEMAIKAIYHLFERLAQIGTDLGNKIGEGLKKVGPKLKAIFIDPIKNGIQWIKDRFRDLWSLGANIVNNIKKGIKHGIDAVYNAIIKPILDGLDKMKELVVKAFEAGKNFIQGFINGVTEVGTKAVESITWLGEKVVEGWQVILGEHSPSVIAKQSAVYWIEGFLNGLDKMEGSLENNVANIGSIVVSGMNDAVAASKRDIDAGDITYSIVPIVDMNTAISDISAIGSAIKGIDFDAINSSFTAPAISLSNSEEQVLNVNNQDVVAAVNKLNNRLNDIQKHIDNLQIYLDSGALIGEIKDPLNKEFGRMVTQSKRRKV